MENIGENDSPERAVDLFINAFMKIDKDFTPLCKHVGVERRRMRRLIAKENINRGKILNYHLILENLIERILLASIHEYNPDKVRLNFANKVELLPKSNRFYRLFLDGVKKINSIRNKYAHDLSYEINDEDVSDMRYFIESLNRKNQSKVKILTPIEVVEEYAIVTSTIFIFYTPELRVIVSQLSKEYSGLFDMIKQRESESKSLKEFIDKYADHIK